jgi:hypothetical protein
MVHLIARPRKLRRKRIAAWMAAVAVAIPLPRVMVQEW